MKLQEIWNMTFFCCPCLSQQSSNDADENELQKQKNTLDSTKENPNDQPGGSSQYSAASGVSRMLLFDGITLVNKNDEKFTLF